jgi:ADP-ribose pyrophosphatase
MPAREGGYTAAMDHGGPRRLWQCPWWSVEEHEFTGADGTPRRWYCVVRLNPETVHMLALTPEGTVPLLRQWRFPVHNWVWELPAGICDVPGEALAETARRELLEETGYSAGRVVHLFRGTVSPGLTNEMYNAFLCLDLERRGQGGGVGGERIEVRVFPWRDLASQVLELEQQGELVDSKILAHIALAQARLAGLRMAS